MTESLKPESAKPEQIRKLDPKIKIGRMIDLNEPGYDISINIRLPETKPPDEPKRPKNSKSVALF